MRNVGGERVEDRGNSMFGCYDLLRDISIRFDLTISLVYRRANKRKSFRFYRSHARFFYTRYRWGKRRLGDRTLLPAGRAPSFTRLVSSTSDKVGHDATDIQD